MSHRTLFPYFLGFGSCLQLGIISSKSTLLKYPIERNFCEWRDSNPVRLDDQRKLFLCAMLPTPHVKLSRWLRYLIKSLVHWNIFVRRTFGCQTLSDGPRFKSKLDKNEFSQGKETWTKDNQFCCNCKTPCHSFANGDKLRAFKRIIGQTLEGLLNGSQICTLTIKISHKLLSSLHSVEVASQKEKNNHLIKLEIG